MRQVVLDILKYKFTFFCGFVLFASIGFGQVKYEREHRIKKSQFPVPALSFVENKVDGARSIRYYREVDSSFVSYTTKFKKDRLRYGLQFDKRGLLKHIEISIKEIDIPEESLNLIKNYLENDFVKYRVQRLGQHYPVSAEEPVAVTIRNAFQNLILPTIRYKLIFRGKKDGKGVDYEALFASDGSFISIRKSLPSNYDHILY